MGLRSRLNVAFKVLRVWDIIMCRFGVEGSVRFRACASACVGNFGCQLRVEVLLVFTHCSKPTFSCFKGLEPFV